MNTDQIKSFVEKYVESNAIAIDKRVFSQYVSTTLSHNKTHQQMLAALQDIIDEDAPPFVDALFKFLGNKGSNGQQSFVTDITNTAPQQTKIHQTERPTTQSPKRIQQQEIESRPQKQSIIIDDMSVEPHQKQNRESFHEKHQRKDKTHKKDKNKSKHDKKDKNEKEKKIVSINDSDYSTDTYSYSYSSEPYSYSDDSDDRKSHKHRHHKHRPKHSHKRHNKSSSKEQRYQRNEPIRETWKRSEYDRDTERRWEREIERDDQRQKMRDYRREQQRDFEERLPQPPRYVPPQKMQQRQKEKPQQVPQRSIPPQQRKRYDSDESDSSNDDVSIIEVKKPSSDIRVVVNDSYSESPEPSSSSSEDIMIPQNDTNLKQAKRIKQSTDDDEFGGSMFDTIPPHTTDAFQSNTMNERDAPRDQKKEEKKIEKEELNKQQQHKKQRYIIYVCGIDNNQNTVNRLYSHFIHFGPIRCIQVVRKHKYALIEFFKVENAYSAINSKTSYSNKFVKCGFASEVDSDLLKTLESQAENLEKEKLEFEKSVTYQETSSYSTSSSDEAMDEQTVQNE